MMCVVNLGPYEKPLKTLRSRAHSHVIAAAFAHLMRDPSAHETLVTMPDQTYYAPSMAPFSFAGMDLRYRVFCVDHVWWRITVEGPDLHANMFIEKKGKCPWTLRNFVEPSTVTYTASKVVTEKLADETVILPALARYGRPVGSEAYGRWPLPRNPSESVYSVLGAHMEVECIA